MKRILFMIVFIVFSGSVIQAQETKEIKESNKEPEKSQVIIKHKNDTVRAIRKPDVYVNGEKFRFPLEIIDQNIIESVTHIKGEQAMKEYNAPNGVLLVKTKKNIDPNSSKIVIKGEATSSGKVPLIIIDGVKTYDEEKLRKLTPEEIDHMTVSKGSSATKLYGKEAENGVIIVDTKKGKKK